MVDLNFKVVDSKKWDSLPPRSSAKKDDKYTPILDALEAGEILEIPTNDAKEMRGLRITLGRKSSVRGFKVETRNNGNLLYVRKSAEPLEPKAPKERKKKEAASA